MPASTVYETGLRSGSLMYGDLVSTSQEAYLTLEDSI